MITDLVILIKKLDERIEANRSNRFLFGTCAFRAFVVGDLGSFVPAATSAVWPRLQSSTTMTRSAYLRVRSNALPMATSSL
jgi:hypothetical protein